jgi:hypothetical protein
MFVREVSEVVKAVAMVVRSRGLQEGDDGRQNEGKQ